MTTRVVSPRSGRILREGKTKWITEVTGKENTKRCILKAKKDVTKFDNPDLTEELQHKDEWSTTTTAGVFGILKAAGIRVAFERWLSKTKILAPLCRMIPLECIARRVAEGSYCNRNTSCSKGTRFQRLEVEFFLKTSAGFLQPFHGTQKVQIMPPNPNNANNRPDDDPLILNPHDSAWTFVHSKKPVESEAPIMEGYPSSHVLPVGVSMADLEKMTRQVFLVLEKAWGVWGWPMSDLKIEFGVDDDGNLYVADVIDADSWRLYDAQGNPMSKQVWRDGKTLKDLAAVYRKVAAVSEHLEIPTRQAILVCHQGHAPELNIPSIAGVDVKYTVAVDPKNVLGLLGNYTQGGVIISSDYSLSDAMALSAATSWPVIDDHSARTSHSGSIASNPARPAYPAVLTASTTEHAIHGAMNVLAQTNPAAYMHRQYAIEESLRN